MKNDVINAIRTIEAACFDVPWSLTAIIAGTSNPDAIFLSEEIEGETVGFLLGTSLSGDYEILRIAVLPEFQRAGVAYKLMTAFIEKCRETDDTGSIYLEVRSSNTAAIKLYEKCSFVKRGFRERYYGDDDAIIMRLEL
ncbi:MAG: ribosomal protein S18-alanine N-acetyltransferase [Oscillospiraceae bacterium]|nr:ribosomal protein S18-alanine N-acetyltransferase [Oscillospiraceae bacterium]